ncbi:MAG: DUF2125 domain-containing protein, partial [Caulobacteraceae bacterium]
VNGWERTPLRLSVEGDDMTFAPQPGAKPFPLAGAANVQFYTRPGPNDQGAIYMTVAGGAAAVGTWLDRFAQGKPVGLTFDAIASHVSAFSGPNFVSSVAGWSKAGGALQVRNLALSADGASVQATSAAISLSPDGRLAGLLTAKTAEPGRLLAALGSDASAPTTAPGGVVFTFKDGRTFVGAYDLGPAPGVF